MDLVLRTIFMYLLVLLLTRSVGRRELGSLEPFDMIMLIVIGDLVQQGVTQSDYSLTGMAIVITTLALMTVLFAYAGFKFKRLRPVIEGEPIVLVKDGEVLERNMRTQRLTMHEIESEARMQQIGSLDEIRFAILETSGKISFVTKS
jgi:uncharacterized membrane protein YcaP (DUF421 family)